jgi:hypothetical protein
MPDFARAFTHALTLSSESECRESFLQGRHGKMRRRVRIAENEDALA